MAAMLKYFSLAILAMWVLVVPTIGANPEDHSPEVAPEPAGVDCTSLIYNMVDCISFFSVGSNETEPSFLCCLGFRVVLDTDAECICEGLKSSVHLGIEIDLAKAATLPSACGVSAPSFSNCDVSSAPSPGPSPAPAPAPAPVNGKQILNPAPAPSRNSGAYATTCSSAVYFGLVMLVSFIF